MTNITAPRKRPFGKLALLVVVIVAAWSGFWTYVRSEIGKGIDLFIEQAGAQGVELTCKDRTITGYPFRIEVNCGTPGLLAANGTGMDARHLRVTGLVYNPNRYIAELTGPFGAHGQTRTLEATWTSLIGSLHLAEGEIARLSLVAKGFDGNFAGPDVPLRKLAFSKGEFHIMAAADAMGPTLSNYDISGLLDQVSANVEVKPKGMLDPSAALTNVLKTPFDAKLDAALRNLRKGRELDPRAFAHSNGTLDIRALTVELGDTVLRTVGSLGLGQDGRANGALEIQTLAAPTPSQPAKPKPMALTVGLALLQQLSKPTKDAEGHDMRALDLSIEHGRILMGATPVAALAPLF